MTPADIPLYCSLTCSQKDELLTSGAFASVRDGMPFTNDDPISDPRDSAITAITARCYMFDLNDEKNRTEYADIIAKTKADSCFELAWERQVETANGLVVYMTVIEYAQITKKTMDALNE